MSANGLVERRNTLARIKSLAGGNVQQGSFPDDAPPPRTTDGSGKIAPHIILDFGAPIRSTRDRSMGLGEKGQPHILTVNIACIAGDASAAERLMGAVFDSLLDWAPSDSADPFEAKGGYGSRRPATENTPTRFVEGLFFESIYNQSLPQD